MSLYGCVAGHPAWSGWCARCGYPDNTEWRKEHDAQTQEELGSYAVQVFDAESRYKFMEEDFHHAVLRAAGFEVETMLHTPLPFTNWFHDAYDASFEIKGMTLLDWRPTQRCLDEWAVMGLGTVWNTYVDESELTCRPREGTLRWTTRRHGVLGGLTWDTWEVAPPT